MILRFDADVFRDAIKSIPVAVERVRKTEYLAIPAGFDIETTSTYVDGEKAACMYVWMFGIGSTVWYGRTWDEFKQACAILVDVFHLRPDRVLTIWVHNLAFEFQFIRKFFSWHKVFATAPRRPIYAAASCGIRFRCTYMLTGESLAKVAEHLKRHHIEKLTGDLDYTVLRHSGTPLTDQDLAYCENDVRILLDLIAERIEDDGGISKIPLTKTAYVRQYCKEKCLYGGDNHKGNPQYFRYRKKVAGLTLAPDEYQLAREAFAGGFTHACAWWADRPLENVGSGDIASSYPSVMVSECRFPMGKGVKQRVASRRVLDRLMRDYCCIFRVDFVNIRSKVMFEHYISQSKCHRLTEAVVDNGRVVEADELSITVTELDFAIIRAVYDWDKMRVGTLYRYQRGYLPVEYVSTVLDLYYAKTAYKNVPGKEEEYMQAKINLNSLYGMTVTAIVRDEIEYNDGAWDVTPGNVRKELSRYNAKPDRFLSYLWGVYVTALARANIWRLIFEFGRTDDYVYCDTDSVKGLHYDRHAAGIQRYNDRIRRKMEAAAAWHGIPLERFMPADPDGVRHMMGIFEFEHIYDRFRTMGAKRYCRIEDGTFKITVAGVGSKPASAWMAKTFRDPVAAFDDDLVIPADHTGKLTHTYIDDAITFDLTDYTGLTATCHEESYIHLEKASYDMTMSLSYAEYLAGVIEYEK